MNHKKLQILVPQYKETIETIQPLLNSIALQQNINFEELGVIICNDGSDVLLNKDLLNFIRQLTNICSIVIMDNKFLLDRF